MAFDGITVAALAAELHTLLAGGRISRISQPEKDELLILVRSDSGNHRVRLSANAGLPLVCITQSNAAAPMTAPAFCMLLRKYLSNGRVLAVRQTGLDRILNFDIEHRNELGDTEVLTLIIELMGKHSNIILCGADRVILDSIKRVPANVSSLREVLPGKEYFTLNTRDQADTLSLTPEIFRDRIAGRPEPLAKALNRGLSGISPLMSEELCARAGLDSSLPAASYSDADLDGLYREVRGLADAVRSGDFSPCILYEGDAPKEFSAVDMKLFEGRNTARFSGMSELIETYYSEKGRTVRLRQRSADLRHVVQTRLERAVKKADLQRKQLADTEKKDVYRVYGELLNTYGYSLKGGEKSLSCVNYYTDEEIEIPLDPRLSASENAKKYFARYGKLKRTAEAVVPQLAQSEAEIEHLESVRASLESSETEEDLNQIRAELAEAGFLKTSGRKEKKRQEKSGPLHFVTEDGFHIYVGKNNYQNEEVTFRIANGGDWWFHAKQAAGSHVIVKTEGRELPDEVFLQAAGLAGYYSTARGAEKAEIDYVLRREVKKVPHSRPGYVIYHTNFSVNVCPAIPDGVTRI
ncbi:MAG: NFACT family protein [Lachnospiraceae bacterium]|nr:NFACT family protein [Lachnospiraceae bacterium]